MFLPGWSGEVKLTIPSLPTNTVQSATPFLPMGSDRLPRSEWIFGCHREVSLPPGFISPCQRTDAMNAIALKEQCGSSAGIFIGAGTIKDNIPVSRYLRVPPGDFIRSHSNGRGEGFR